MSLSVFASHDWGVDRINHDRVKEVALQLRQRGIRVWLDETNMKGNVFDAMCRGIDSCDVVLVFVTTQYIQKVREGAEADHVRREFMYVAHKCPGKMLPVRFDPQLPRSWDGPVGMCLGSSLYVDMATSIDADAVSGLLHAVRRHSGRTMWKTARSAHRRPPPLPPRKAKPSLRVRVQLVRDFYGMEPAEGGSSREILDRIYDDVARGADRTFRAKLEAVERELGV
jgi:hypothetical protein